MFSLKINPLNAPEEVSSAGALDPTIFYSKMTATSSGNYTLADPSNNFENHESWKIIANLSTTSQLLTPTNLSGATDITIEVGKRVWLVWLYNDDTGFAGNWFNVRDSSKELNTLMIPIFPIEEPETITSDTALSLDSYMSEISGNRTVSLADGSARGLQKLVLVQGGSSATVDCSLEGAFTGFDLGANNKARLVWDTSFWRIIDSRGLTKNPV